MDDVREVGHVSSVEVKEVRYGIQVLTWLFSKIVSYSFVGFTRVRDGLVQTCGIGLLVHVERLGQDFERLSHFLVLLLETCHLFTGELVNGGVDDHDVLIHLFGEGLEAFDFALHFLEIQGYIGSTV